MCVLGVVRRRSGDTMSMRGVCSTGYAKNTMRKGVVLI